MVDDMTAKMNENTHGMKEKIRKERNKRI